MCQILAKQSGLVEDERDPGRGKGDGHLENGKKEDGGESDGEQRTRRSRQRGERFGSSKNLTMMKLRLNLEVSPEMAEIRP